MACFEHGTIIELPQRETLTLPDMRGTTLRITRGTVWITQEGDLNDIVLRAGDTWVVERNGLTILEAQDNATFCVLGRHLEVRVSPSNRQASPAWWTRVRDAIAAFFGTPMRQPVPYV